MEGGRREGWEEGRGERKGGREKEGGRECDSGWGERCTQTCRSDLALNVSSNLKKKIHAYRNTDGDCLIMLLL